MVTNSLTPSELHDLTRIHQQCLPDSSLTILGSAVTALYYRYGMNSTVEALFIEKRAGVLAGACLLSLDPQSLQHRFQQAHFISIALQGGLGLLLHPSRWKYVPVLFSTSSTGPALLKKTAEVVQIFTDPQFQHQGVGTALLTHVEDYLKSKHHSSYFVKTLSVDNNPAIKFYERCGFVRVPEERHSNRFCYFLKTLS